MYVCIWEGGGCVYMFYGIVCLDFINSSLDFSVYFIVVMTYYMCCSVSRPIS